MPEPERDVHGTSSVGPGDQPCMLVWSPSGGVSSTVIAIHGRLFPVTPCRQQTVGSLMSFWTFQAAFCLLKLGLIFNFGIGDPFLLLNESIFFFSFSFGIL